MLEKFMSTIYFSNTGQEWLQALGVFIAGLVILKIFQLIIIARLKKISEQTKNDFDDVLIAIISNIKWPFYFLLSLFFALRPLVLPQLFWQIVKGIFLVVVAWELVKLIEKLIHYFALKAMSKNGDDESSRASLRTLSVIIKIILWALALVLILGNLGVDVTSLVAGLGIGGVAVALAIQNILGDIFASFSILIDKPFKVGDFIKIGDDMGTVEKIGIKTTRIKTLLGEELIVSNKELTSARVQNFKRMDKRRVVFTLGVIYETQPEKLKQVPQIIKKVISETDKTEFDRCHFSAFGDFSLNFETVYYVNSADYNAYMDIHQQVNLKIFEEFAKAEIEFAYPTQVEYQKKMN